jgi:hypothetical protein
MSALTPPAVKTKSDAPKVAKPPKAAKAPVDPNAPKKERAPRKDYGYHKDAKIEVLTRAEDAKPYRGMRKDWYEAVQKYNGKTCNQFVEGNKGKKSEKGTTQNAASWLRFFVDDKAIKLHKPEA